jgi:hypothetical protein
MTRTPRRLWDVRTIPVTVTEPMVGRSDGTTPGRQGFQTARNYRPNPHVTWRGHTFDWYCHRCRSAAMATFCSEPAAAAAARTHVQRVCSALPLTARQRLDAQEPAA